MPQNGAETARGHLQHNAHHLREGFAQTETDVNRWTRKELQESFEMMGNRTPTPAKKLATVGCDGTRSTGPHEEAVVVLDFEGLALPWLGFWVSGG